MSTKPNAHFMLSSVFTWCVTGDVYTLSDAVKLMDKEKQTYHIWYVPCPHDTMYEIAFFAPLVEGAYVVECVEFKHGKRVKATKTKE